MGATPSLFSESPFHSLFPIRHYAFTSGLIWLVFTYHLPVSPLANFSHRRGLFLAHYLVHICNHNPFTHFLSYTDLRLLPPVVTPTVTTAYLPLEPPLINVIFPSNHPCTIPLPAGPLMKNADKYRDFSRQSVHVC